MQGLGLGLIHLSGVESMNWFSGTLRQTSSGGWNTIKEWFGISFDEACKITEEIRKSDPNAYFLYEPCTTSM